MSLLTKINRMERLHALIQQKKTGTPLQLSEQLQISRATLYILIDELNALNMPTTYSRRLQTFYYERDVKLTLSFKVEFIESDVDLRNINGGFFTFSLPSYFSDGRNLSLHPYLASTKSQLTGL